MVKHADTATHQARLVQLAEREEHSHLDTAQRQMLETGPSVPPRSELHRLIQSHRPAMFDHNPNTVHYDPQMTSSSSLFGSEWDSQLSWPPQPADEIIPVGMQPLSDSSTKRRQELEQQLAELFQQAEHFDEFGDESDEENFDIATGLEDGALII